MSFIPTGLLNDVKKLANIEKNGQVIAYATNYNNNKKKKEHKHEKKNKSSRNNLTKDNSDENQLPSLNIKNNIAKNEANNKITSKETLSSIDNLKNKSSNTTLEQSMKEASLEKINNIKNKSISNNSNNILLKDTNQLNKELKINQNSMSRTSSPLGKIKLKQTKSPVEASAFQYPNIKAKVGHLQNKNNKLKHELAFLYDYSNNSSEVKEKGDDVDNNKDNHISTIVNDIIPKVNITNNNIKNNIFNDSGNVTSDEINIITKSVIPKNLNPKELIFVTSKDNELDDDNNMSYPSLAPVSRKEVILLKYEMMKSLKKKGLIDNDGNDINYPTDMHSFLKIIKEEQQLYDIVFKELIRQVTIQMAERGELLSYLRRRYSNMFSKIPEHILNIHTELIAQRKISERLASELMRSKEVILKLIKEIDEIKIHDQEISKQAEKAQNKLLNILTESDSNDLVLEEYQKLYRMQRNRLEENNKLTENEKRTWTNLAISLALRVGREHGFPEIIQLQSYCNTRLLSSIQIISFINDERVKILNELDKKIDSWNQELIELSHSIIEEDDNNIETLTKLSHEISLIQNNFDVSNDTENETEFSKNVNMFDFSVLMKSLTEWINMTTEVSSRFTSDKDIIITEKIKLSKSINQEWCEYAYTFLRKLKKSPNGKRFATTSDKLNIIIKLIEEWYLKLEVRVTGEDGVASQVISLQNQVEDRFNNLNSKGPITKLSQQDKHILNGYLNQWQTQINSLLSSLRVSSKSDMDKVPKNISSWISNIRELLNSEYEFQKEENEKINQNMLSWMAGVLAQVSKDANSALDENEKELSQLLQELYLFNTSLKDCDNYIEEGENNDKIKKLTDIIKNISDNWEKIAKKLLKHEKDEKKKMNEIRKNENLTVEELISRPDESMNLINSISECSKMENQTLSITNPELNIDMEKINSLKGKKMED